MKNFKRGFTLIELLIVISIIALLAAISFPVFARARENARRASCQSNLKQLALGMAQYVQDYDGTYPKSFSHWQADSSVPGGQALYGWANMIFPYVKSLQIYQCPSEKHPINPALKQADWLEVYDYTDYAYNWNFSWTFDPPHSEVLLSLSSPFYGGIRESRLSAPAVTVLLFDNGNMTQRNQGTEPGDDAGYECTTNINGECVTRTDSTGTMAMERHLEGANYVFADGHIKWLKHSRLSRGYTGNFAASTNYCQPSPMDDYCNAQPPSSLNGVIGTYATNDY